MYVDFSILGWFLDIIDFNLQNWLSEGGRVIVNGVLIIVDWKVSDFCLQWYLVKLFFVIYWGVGILIKVRENGRKN